MKKFLFMLKGIGYLAYYLVISILVGCIIIWGHFFIKHGLPMMQSPPIEGPMSGNHGLGPN